MPQRPQRGAPSSSVGHVNNTLDDDTKAEQEASQGDEKGNQQNGDAQADVGSSSGGNKNDEAKSDVQSKNMIDLKVEDAEPAKPKPSKLYIPLLFVLLIGTFACFIALAVKLMTA